MSLVDKQAKPVWDNKPDWTASNLIQTDYVFHGEMVIATVKWTLKCERLCEHIIEDYSKLVQITEVTANAKATLQIGVWSLDHDALASSAIEVSQDSLDSSSSSSSSRTDRCEIQPMQCLVLHSCFCATTCHRCHNNFRVHSLVLNLCWHLVWLEILALHLSCSCCRAGSFQHHFFGCPTIL